MAFTTLYLRNNASPHATKPSGFLGAWGTVGAAGNRDKTLEATNGSASVNLTVSTTGSHAAKDYGIGAFHSPALAAQSIASGNWTIGLTGQYPTTGGGRVWTPRMSLYLVDGGTGAIRTTIFAIGDIGATGRTASALRTGYSTTIAGGAATVTANDYLVLEIGLNVTTTGDGTKRTLTMRFANSTAISSDNVANTTPMAFLTAPASIAEYVASGALDGSSAGTSTAAASALALDHALSAASTGTSTAGATLTPPTTTLAGASDGVSTAGATLGADQTLPAAISTGTSTAAATGLALTSTFSAAAAGTSTAEGVLGTSGVGLLSAASTGVSSALASNIALTASLRAALNGNSQPTYATWLNFLAQPVAATSTGTSTVAGDLTVLVPLEASSTGASTAGADALTQTQPLAGASAGTSTVVGSALRESHALAGAAGGVSSALASMLTLAHAMAAASVGTSTVVGDLVTVLPSFGPGPSGGLGAPSGGGQGAIQGPSVIPGVGTSGMSVPGQR